MVEGIPYAHHVSLVGLAHLRFYDDNTGKYVGFYSGGQSVDWAYRVPITPPSQANMLLSTNAIGIMAWQTPSVVRQNMGVPAFESADPGATNIYPRWDDVSSDVEWISGPTLAAALGVGAGGSPFTSVLTPSPYSTDQNNLDITGYNVLRISSTVSPIYITGLAGGTAGALLMIINLNPTDAYGFSFLSESSASTAANRIVDDFYMYSNDVALLWYDGATSRWRLVNHQRSV